MFLTHVSGPVNSFLSWSFFSPLSRLTYCVYLIHLNFLTMYIARMRQPFFYTLTDTVMLYFSLLVTAFGLSFIISLTIEASFLNLEKLIFNFGRGRGNSQHFFHKPPGLRSKFTILYTRKQEKVKPRTTNLLMRYLIDQWRYPELTQKNKLYYPPLTMNVLINCIDLCQNNF